MAKFLIKYALDSKLNIVLAAEHSPFWPNCFLPCSFQISHNIFQSVHILCCQIAIKCEPKSKELSSPLRKCPYDQSKHLMTPYPLRYRCYAFQKQAFFVTNYSIEKIHDHKTLELSQSCRSFYWIEMEGN